MRKLVLTALFGFALGIPGHAEVVIRLRPPVSIREHRTARPSRDHVWVGGYHRYEGNAYHWQAGRWEQPPRAHAVWVTPRYTHRHDGYVYTEGHWRQRFVVRAHDYLTAGGHGVIFADGWGHGVSLEVGGMPLFLVNTQPIISVVALVDVVHAMVEAEMVPIFRAAMIKGLHKTWIPQKPVKVIATTSVSQAPELAKAIDLGVDAVVPETVSPEKWRITIEAVLRKARPAWA